jgi:hypothetical protein
MPKRAKGPEAIPKALSEGEEEFAWLCKLHRLYPEREHIFCLDRKWRFDFAWPEQKIAVEIEGGTLFGKSRHSRGQGFVSDCRKYNTAALMGWRVLRFTTEMVKSGCAIDSVMEVIP